MFFSRRLFQLRLEFVLENSVVSGAVGGKIGFSNNRHVKEKKKKNEQKRIFQIQFILCIVSIA